MSGCHADRLQQVTKSGTPWERALSDTHNGVLKKKKITQAPQLYPVVTGWSDYECIYLPMCDAAFGEGYAVLEILTFRSLLVATFSSFPTSLPFWNSNSVLWQDGGGQSRENTKIASSDLSFINFSTPAATHWNRLWQRKKRKNQPVRWSI